MTPFNFDPDIEDTDDGSSEAGGIGSGKPLVDPSLFGDTNYFYLEMLRKEEAKMGTGVPITKDPSQQHSQEAGAHLNGPQRHPLLNSQRLDGIADNSLDTRPSENEAGQENYLQEQLVHRPAPSATPTPTKLTLTPGH